MKTRNASGFDLAFILVAGAAIPVAMGAAVLAAGDGLPGQALAVMLGVYGTALVMGLMMAAGERQPAGAPRLADVGGAGASQAAVLELTDILVAPPVPLTFEVARATGVCPLGFRPGHTWTVDASGRISRPICQPGAIALTAMLARRPEGEMEREAPCRCPLGDRELVFAWRN